MSDISYLVRPLTAGLLTFAINSKVLGENNYERNGQFAVSVAVGMSFADLVAPYVVEASGQTAGNVTNRITEIIFGSATAYTVNKYIFGNGPRGYTTNSEDLFKKGMTIVFADIASNVLLDLITAKPVSIFN